MKKIVDTFRFILISPELLFGLVVWYVLILLPDLPTFISSVIFNQDMKWDNYLKLFGLPTAILIYNYKMSESILNPDDKGNRQILKEWPNYWMVKNRINFSLLVSILVLIGSLFSWYYALNYDMRMGTLILLILWSISLGSFVSVAKAKLDLKDILY